MAKIKTYPTETVVTLVLGQEARRDLLRIALEDGASYYWCDIQEKAIDRVNDYPGDSFTDCLLSALRAGEKVEIFDREEGTKLGTLSFRSLLKADKLICAARPWAVGDIVSGNLDGTVADIWFQLACLGDVPFG